MGWRRKKASPERQARAPRVQSRGVFSYNTNQTIRAAEQSRGDDRPAKPTYKRTSFWERHWVRNFPSLVALAAVTLSVLYCLSLSTNPRVVVAGNSVNSIILRDKEAYQRGAQDILNQSFLSYSKFTVDVSGFEKAFKEAFPEVDDVSLALPLVSRRPVVTISTAQPELIMTAGGQAYVLDKRGSVIMLAKDLSSSVRDSLVIVTDQSGLEVTLGKTVLPAEQVSYIASVIEQLKAKNVAIESVTLPASANQLDIKPQGVPYFVKFNMTTDAREGAGSYLAVKQKLEQAKIMPAQYVDVRVPGRAYYQ